MEDLIYELPLRQPITVSAESKGKIGTTATQVRLKQTGVYDAPRFARGSTGVDSKWRGSYVSSGQQVNPNNGGVVGSATATVVRPSRRRLRGTVITSNYPNQSRRQLVFALQVPYLSWKQKLAEATSDYGSEFSDLPNGYSPEPGTTLRGGNYPTARFIMGAPPPGGQHDSEIIIAKRVLDKMSRAIPSLNQTTRVPGTIVDN